MYAPLIIIKELGEIKICAHLFNAITATQMTILLLFILSYTVKGRHHFHYVEDQLPLNACRMQQPQVGSLILFTSLESEPLLHGKSYWIV